MDGGLENTSRTFWAPLRYSGLLLHELRGVTAVGSCARTIPSRSISERCDWTCAAGRPPNRALRPEDSMTMTTTNLTRATVVLVHAAWADASSWNKIIPLLQMKGIQVAAVQIPLTSLS